VFITLNFIDIYRDTRSATASLLQLSTLTECEWRTRKAHVSGYLAVLCVAWLVGFIDWLDVPYTSSVFVLIYKPLGQFASPEYDLAISQERHSNESVISLVFNVRREIARSNFALLRRHMQRRTIPRHHRVDGSTLYNAGCCNPQSGGLARLCCEEMARAVTTDYSQSRPDNQWPNRKFP
jgi:hypothetical protein